MLKVSVYSFSYKKLGVPFDESEHGGGFAFDCRCVPNPGREEKYKARTGQDSDVIAFLEALEETENFYKNAEALALQSTSHYLERGFDSLMICFGCTGGQHRSVYFAERLGTFLSALDNVEVEVSHRELPRILLEIENAALELND